MLAKASLSSITSSIRWLWSDKKKHVKDLVLSTKYFESVDGVDVEIKEQNHFFIEELEQEHGSQQHGQ